MPTAPTTLRRERPDSLLGLVYEALQEGDADTPRAHWRPFGAAGRRGPRVDPELLSNCKFDVFSLAQAPVMTRMLETNLGHTALQQAGDDPIRGLQTIKQLGCEAIAECLRVSGQVSPDERTLISTLPGDSAPVVMVLTDRDIGNRGRLASDLLDLPLTLLFEVISSPFASRSRRATVAGTPEFRLLQALSGSVSLLPELFAIGRPEIVYLPNPPMEEICALSPAVSVGRGNQVSTIGIVCRDRAGNLGVTACYHGTGPTGTTVMIDQRPYSVQGDDKVQDLVFIPVDDVFQPIAPRARNGLRLPQDLVPAPNEPVSFDGFTNPNSQTWVQSSDPWLFNLDPAVQLRIQTTKDTDLGDSGSALIDRNDKLIGFAFRMSKHGYRPEFTEWIWAPNALAALDLTLV